GVVRRCLVPRAAPADHVQQDDGERPQIAGRVIEGRRCPLGRKSLCRCHQHVRECCSGSTGQVGCKPACRRHSTPGPRCRPRVQSRRSWQPARRSSTGCSPASDPGARCPARGSPGRRRGSAGTPSSAPPPRNGT
ncbi:unnamed protein product, partial [Mycena citricolor]